MTWGFENVNIIFWLVVSTNGFQLVWLETPNGDVMIENANLPLVGG